MKLKSTKKAADIALEGIKVELDVVDGSVKAVVLTDAKGSFVRIAHRDYSSMCVEVPAPPEIEKKFKLSGSVLGLPVEKMFDQKYEAEEERNRLESDVRGEDNVALKIEQVDVPVAA